MSKAFVDTTILCDALGMSTKIRGQVATEMLGKYGQTEAPYYGLKELRAGPLSYWIYAHNVLVAEKTIEDAIDRVRRSGGFKPRKAAISSGAITNGLLAVISELKRAAAPKDYDEKAELQNYLCRRIFKFWNKRRSVVSRIVQPLSCFTDSDLTIDENQLIRFAGDGSECSKSASCGAANELHRHPVEVNTILEALRPPKTIEKGEKRETTRRRSALKEVLARAKRFS